MTTLSHFSPPPPSGFFTTCEKNAQLCLSESTSCTLKNENLEFDDINCASEKCRFTRFTELSGKAVFLENNDSSRILLHRAWSKHGFTGVLTELANSKQKSKGHCEHMISSWASFVLSILKSLRLLQLAAPSDVLINDISNTRNWGESYVRCFAWHPHSDKIAVAVKDDEILIKNYSHLNDEQTLKHHSQKGITDLSWKPFSATVLAVACHSCVMIWHVTPSSAAVKSQSIQTAQLLSKPGHSPVSSVAWSPQGNYLVSCSPLSNAILVWNIDLEEHQAVKRVGCGGFVSAKFSPDSLKLMTSSTYSSFRLWDCMDWSCETWSKLSGRCQSYCWSPDGSTMLFATSEDPTVYSITFPSSDVGSILNVARSPTPVISLGPVQGLQDDADVCVGGLVQSLAWDPHGERLAIMFKGISANLIALFQTRWKPSFEAIPRGFIRGKADEIAICMSFKPSYENGSLLTVAWSSGRVSHIPLHYTPNNFIGTNGETSSTPSRRLPLPRLIGFSK